MGTLSLDALLAFEAAFDRGQLSKLKLAPELAPLGEALSRLDWDSVSERAFQLFSSSSETLLLGFSVQWGVAAVESHFDPVQREVWLKRWEDIPGWASDPYCHYLWTFQFGLTAFFSGALREADARFRRAHELASEMKYERGQMRSLFHLGLTARDLGKIERATDQLQQALALARTRQAERYRERIEAQLTVLGGRRTELGFESIRAEITEHLRSGDIPGARARLAKAEQRRRKLGLRRRNESFYTFLPLIAAARGKSWLASRMLARIDDPILKIGTLELKAATLQLSETERSELATLKSIHGLSANSDPDSAEVCGRRVQDIPDDDVKSLLKLLLESTESVTKEQICRRVWNLSYDPVLHDGKVYKLFHRARSHFDHPELFVNCYGAYRINRNLSPRRKSRRLKAIRVRRLTDT